MALDLQLSGAAAQYGRGMISDVTAILMRDFADRMQTRIDALDRGVSPDQVTAARSASGFGIATAGDARWRSAACCGASSCPTDRDPS